VKLANEGMKVGNWKIGKQAIDMKTVGLGGDSRISCNRSKELVIGPQRAAPLSWLADKWPGVSGELEEVDSLYRRHTRWLYDFFYLLRDISDDSSYNDDDRRVASRLAGGPVSLVKLAEYAGRSVYDFNIDNLEKNGIVMRSGLTPTDIMHITGSFKAWNSEAALICAKAMAERLGISLEHFTERVEIKVKENLYLNIVKLLIDTADSEALGDKIERQAENLIMMGYRENNTACGKHHEPLRISAAFTTDCCLVGLGAPIHIFLPDVAKSLKTRCIIPENAPVANAVGAITGNITVEEYVKVCPRFEVFGVRGYTCHSQSEKTEFRLYEDAVLWAKQRAAQLAEEEALARGACEVSVTVEVSEKTVSLDDNSPAGISGELYSPQGVTAAGDNYDAVKNAPGGNSNNEMLLETVVTAFASGRIKWL
jgi:N-methylhydantoinase A/oxoprolinase/acetone carboxylase beta subunit